MALQGQVSTMSLPDLFQWIGNAGKSGELAVVHADSTTRVRCNEGRIGGCSSDDPPKLLGQVLLFEGLVTEDVLRSAMSEQASTGRGLPEILVDREVLSVADIDRVVAAKTRETILGLFDWDDAEFVFDSGFTESRNVVELDLDVQDIMLDGMKRLDDKAQIASLFEDPTMVLAHTAKEPDSRLFVDWPKRMVYMSIDGHRTIEEITLRVHGTEFRVGMILLDLLHDGVIETRGLRPAESRNDALDPRGHADDEVMDTETAHEDFLDRIPIPTRARQELGALGVSAEEDFLLSLSDGTWDVRALTWVAPMRPVDVVSSLKRLHERGLVELRTEAGASSKPSR